MSGKIVLTGGGTAGHVTPNIALLPGLKARNFDIRYIGSYDGMERGLIEAEGIPYDGIATGKFRRYLSAKNISDVVRVQHGYHEALKLLRKYRPDVVFSKGGFVSVPVVSAAHRLHIPVIIHESDMTPGLANRLSFRAATKICCNFPETVGKLPEGKAVLSGSPIREEVLSGSREKGLAFTGFDGKKPILLMIGGSSGARRLNLALRSALPILLPDFDVIHLCGKGNLNEDLALTPGYVQYEYISAELKDLFAAADIVFSRAGANAICELLALRKPNLLVPLPASVSRGDQILNARSFEKQGFSLVIEEEYLTSESLIEGIRNLYANRFRYAEAMAQAGTRNGVDVILNLIDEITAE